MDRRSIIVRFALPVLMAGGPVVGADQDAADQHAADQHAVPGLDARRLDRLAVGDVVRLPHVRLGADDVTLELRRFSVTSPRTRFVVGHGGALAFDPSRVRLLRGGVTGVQGSHAFIAVTDDGSVGWIEVDGAGRFSVSGRGSGGRIRIARDRGGRTIPVPACGLDADFILPGRPPETRAATSAVSRDPKTPSSRGLRQLELAVETDYEYFELFGNTDAAASYLVALYGAVSEIYRRDLDIRVDLVFARLWDQPDDLFNGPEPLPEFRSHWNTFMGEVERDAAQFFSGRRDLPYGGIAYLESLCDASSYSVCAYALGFFVDPETPSVFNRDVTVAAHELGHNAGTPHTHDLGIDTCDDENSAPQRGTIMSYCEQTFTGGAANGDLRFHTVVQGLIRDYVDLSACVAADCNGNGVPDEQDIAGGASADVNGNLVPDECEDCNGNGTLDDEDIASGDSLDVDANGIPDECEPDCNGNAVPDAKDIVDGTSQDLYGNGIPDECEPDCGGAPGSDYVEIQADMSLDLNRNAALDECDDCDGDGTPDLVALDHAHDIWIAGFDHLTIRSYLSQVGTLVDVGDDAGLGEPQDLVIDSDRRVFVTSRLDHRVVRFDVDGALHGDFVPGGAGGLLEPAGMTFTPSGNLLVVSSGTDSVLEYDATTGAFVGALVASGAGGLESPFGIAYGPGGHLYVTSDGQTGADGRVLEYDAAGQPVRVFVSAADNGGLAEPRGLLFLPSGNLLVASYGTDQVLEYDGATGAFIRQFNRGGTVDRLTLDQPWGLRLGPDGDVYVSRSHLHEEGRPDDPAELHLTNARVYQFDVESGRLVRAYVLGVDSGIEFPTGFDFVPDTGAIDCNANLRPDSCDVAGRFSGDANANGRPDECEPCAIDLDVSGVVGFADLLIVLARWGPCPKEGSCAGDVDNDGEVDFADLLGILANWGTCPSSAKESHATPGDEIASRPGGD